MERAFNTGDFFGEPAFADVTIEFSGRELRAHKIILCTRSKYFERALKDDRFKEGKEGVLELHDDDPTALYDMLKYICTSNYGSGNPDTLQRLRYGSPWGRHLELAIIADKYGITSLKDTALKLLESGDLLRTIPEVIKFTKRARQIPVEQHRLNSVIARASAPQFVSCFKHASFRQWLNEHPPIRDELCAGYVHPLMKTEAFRNLLQSDNRLAVKMLESMMSKHGSHIMSCVPRCRRSIAGAAMPDDLQSDIESEDDEDGNSVEGETEASSEEASPSEEDMF